MAILRANEIQRFVTQPQKDVLGVLVYGPNEGRVADISSTIVKSILGSIDDPFNLVHLSENQLKDSPGLLHDEMLALSFTGGRKVIWIKDPGPVFNKQFTGLFELSISENLLIIQTGQLKKTIALRKNFEASKVAVCIPCYDDSRQDLTALIIEKINSNGKSINQTTIDTLINSVGSDRVLLMSEVEKLISYCAESSQVTEQDIEVLCADPLEGSLDDICDLTLTGDTSKCLTQLHHLISSGIQSAQILNTVLNHLMRLQRYRIDIEKGQNIETVVKGARPPIFFKRQSLIKRQLSYWQTHTIKNALTIVFDAISQTRQNASLDDNICERTLIALSKRAQAYAR